MQYTVPKKTNLGLVAKSHTLSQGILDNFISK